MTAVNLSDSTRLPRQIRERMQRIEQITAESQPANQPEPAIAANTPEPPPAEPAPGPTPPPELPASPSQDTLLPQVELRPFNDPALATDPRASNPEYWRNRLSVMQGKLREAQTKAQAREDELLSKIETLEAQLQAAKASGQPAPKVDLTTMFTPEQVEALGEDQASAIATAAITAARAQVDSVLTQERTTQQTQRQRETEREQNRRHQAFLDALGEVVPNWAVIDQRTDWRQWLAQIDPQTGHERQAALTAGINAGDVNAVSAIFASFLRAVAPRPTPPVAAPTNDAGRPPAPPPSGSRDLSAVAPSDAEIKEFYKQAALGKVSNDARVAFEKRLALL